MTKPSTTTQETRELKPCPLCGSNANAPDNVSTGRPVWEVECSQYCFSLRRTMKQEAIRAWNTRAPSDTEIRLREALERTTKLASLLTVRQVINAGDEYIDAAGLNPWCMNEGLAPGEESISVDFARAALQPKA
jgi:hypothetical protein